MSGSQPFPKRFKAGYLDRLDGRTSTAMELKERWQEFTDDLGGVDGLSYQQRSLVERALWLEHWLHTQERELCAGRLRYEPAGKSRSELYLDLLPALSAGQVELPDDDKLFQQLVGLERRTSRMGRDLIDHAPGAHDDRANAVAGLVSIGLKPEVLPNIRRIGSPRFPIGPFGLASGFR
ncbi:MAG: hypothetical protein JXR14_06225 [Paracoccaceae bacterium]